MNRLKIYPNPKRKMKYRTSSEYSRFYKDMLRGNWGGLARQEWKKVATDEKAKAQKYYMGSGYSGYTAFLEAGWWQNLIDFIDAILGKYGVVYYGAVRYPDNYYNGIIKEQYP